MKRKFNNKGFTLVEVIITIAILAFVVLGVSLLMTTGARTFSSVETTVSLQEESQLAMQFVQEKVIDVSQGILNNGGTLTFYTKDTNTNTETSFNFRADSNQGLLYKENGGDENIVSEHLIVLNITMQPLAHPMYEGVEVVETIDVEMEFKLRGKTYKSTQTISLRNKPVYSITNEADIDKQVEIIQYGEDITP